MSPPAEPTGNRAVLRRLPFLCLLLGLGLVPPSAAENIDSGKQAKYQNQLKLLRERLGGLQKRLETKQGERDGLTLRLRQSEQRIGRLARGLRSLEGRLKRQRSALQGLRDKEAEQQRLLDRQRDMLERQVRAAYGMGRQEQLKLLLNQQDPATVARVLAYYDYLNRDRIARIRLVRERLSELQTTQQQIGEEQGRLEALLSERTQEKAALDAEQRTRRDLLARVTREISDQGQQLSQLRSDEKQLQSLLRGLQEALLEIPAAPVQQKRFAQLRGNLRWPVQGVIRHAFGEPKIGALRWDGVMIAAPEGREVRAVHAGRVAYADWLRGFGLLLILDHGEGYMTLYGHNQSLFKEVGDSVEAGEPVAATGSTGGRREAGVYFAVRRAGKAVNPTQWCLKPRGRRVG